MGGGMGGGMGEGLGASMGIRNHAPLPPAPGGGVILFCPVTGGLRLPIKTRNHHTFPLQKPSLVLDVWYLREGVVIPYFDR